MTLVRKAILASCLALMACGDAASDSESRQEPALPRGMRIVPPLTNADEAPPRVPFDATTPRLLVKAVQTFPHDTLAYTQGLVIDGKRLFESTGLFEKSDVRVVNATTGVAIKKTALPPSDFGEGIALLDARLYQVTWKTGRGYVYDANTLERVDSLRYEGEGWGLTTDGTLLYLSDGSNSIRVLDRDGFQVTRRIAVTEGGKPVPQLNELEWVRGELWANIYQTDFIARIDPIDGHVLGWLDLSALLSTDEKLRVKLRGGVANGIAWDAARHRVAITGKFWPHLFYIDEPASIAKQ